MDFDAQQASQGVPRFASFRPIGFPTPTLRPDENSRSEKRSTSNHYRERSEKSHRQSHQQHLSSLNSDFVEDFSSASKQQSVKYDEPSAFFAIDLKGDPQNLDYGSSYGTTSYSLTAHNIALGLKTVAHRTTPSGKGKESISKQTLKSLRQERVQHFTVGSITNLPEDEGADFVSLQPLKASKQPSHLTENHTPPRNLDKRDQHAIEDRLRLNVEDGCSSDPASSEDDTARLPTLGERLRQRKAALLNKVEQDPRDWRSWLTFVELQNESDGFLHVSSKARPTNAERRSNAEVNLSIYEKALKSVIDPRGRERLHLGMMSEARAVWERSKVFSKWRMILQEHPSSLRIWKKYLDFYQSNLPSFSLDETRKHFLQCIQDVHEFVGPNQPLHSDSYTVQLYILLRLTVLLREAGYVELATATWQGLLEFEFCKPSSFRCTAEQFKDTLHERSLVAFEQFWNSEVPRIGELNARGWLNFDERTQEEPSPPAVAPLQKGGVAMKWWADAERKAGSCFDTPSRSIDGSDDDPYSVVLFSDIKPALIDTSSFPDHHTLLAAFLSFCHLPPHKNDPTNLTDPWHSDQYLRNEMLYDGVILKRFGLISAGNVAYDDGHPDISKAAHSIPCPSLSTPFATPLTKHLISPDTLFSAPGEWFSSFGPDPWSHVPVAKDFVLVTLKTLVKQGIGGEDLAEYLLAFELRVSPRTVSKSAKYLLKKNPSSLRLYNAYALIQNQLGEAEMANTVFATAIRMSATSDGMARHDMVLLWRSRIFILLNTGQATFALEQLLNFGLDESSGAVSEGSGNASNIGSTTAPLRLRNALTAGRDLMLSLSLSTLAVYYSELLVILDYLVNDTILQAVENTFRENLHSLTKNAAPSDRNPEALFRQSFARLLYTHITLKRPYSPSTFRSFLAESITAFPHNTIFLSLYAWNESRFRIDDRVRRIMREVVSTTKNHTREGDREPTDTIIPQAFAIYTDLNRGVAHGSNYNAVRGTFERALQSEGAAHSATLWKLYLLFEFASGDMKRATGVFYRAVRACPWVKELFLLAFEYLGGVMGDRELRGLYTMMVERELRIRVVV
ncbi:MAG: hypothetical protein Q9173_004368 [Seirophora scorigena]